MNNKSVSFFASIGLLIAAAVWGFAFVVVKDSLNYIGPIYMIAFRYTVAAIAMGLLFIKKWRLLNKQYLTRGAISGAFLFIAYATQTIGCNYTTAGKNAFLTTSYVILIPLITWALTKKRPQWHVFLAAVISITGIGLLSLGTGDSKGLNIGDILTLLCGVFFALHIIWTAKYNAQGDDSLFLTLLQFVFCSIYGWIFSPIMDGGFPIEVFQSENLTRIIVSILYLGLFSTMLGFSLQNVGLKYVSSSLASLFLSFESVFGILFGTLLLNEKLTARMIVGCVLIFLAVVLAETKKQKD